MTYRYHLALDTLQQKALNRFYKRQKLNVSVNKLDVTLFCKLDDDIVGAGFIRPIKNSSENILLMRSVFVEPNHRNKGIARQLCKELLQQSGETYTLCETALVPFYQSLGMEVCNRVDLPNVMIQQIKKGLTLLVRPL